MFNISKKLLFGCYRRNFRLGYTILENVRTLRSQNVKYECNNEKYKLFNVTKFMSVLPT